MNENTLHIDRIIETFDFLHDWEQRYQFLDELGARLPALDEADRTEENKVHQCMSQVWVAAHPNEARPDSIQFSGDCDTPTIKGVVAILVVLLSGRTAREIADLDVDAVFSRLQLFEHLSPTRHVGVYAIVEKMKRQAAQWQAQSGG